MEVLKKSNTLFAQLLTSSRSSSSIGTVTAGCFHICDTIHKYTHKESTKTVQLCKTVFVL